MSCRYWNSHQVEDILFIACCLQAWRTSDQLESEGWWCWLPLTTPPPKNQKNIDKMFTPSLNHYHKTHYTLQVETHSYKGISPLWPPLPAKTKEKPKLTKFCSTSSQTCLWDLILCWGTEARCDGCERWTVKKAECWRIDAFELWCWRRLKNVELVQLSHPVVCPLC